LALSPEYRVCVFSFNESWKQTSADGDITMFEFGALTPANTWEFGEFIAGHAETEAVDLIAPQCKPELGVAAVIAKSRMAERGFSVPTCANWHSNFGWINDAPYHLAQARLCVPYLDSILPVSVNVDDDLNVMMGIKAERRIVPSGGVDIEKIRSYARDRTVFESYFPTDGFVLVFVGRLLHNKGLDVLAEALKLLEDASVFALIVGSGPFLGHFEAVATEAGVSDQMEFAGFVPDELVYTILNSADAFVLPSRWESFSISALEAMAAGLPVIGTRVGGFAQWTGDSAHLVAPEDPRELAAAIQRLKEDHDYRSSLATRGEALARKYDWRNIASGSALEYEGLAVGSVLDPPDLSSGILKVSSPVGELEFDQTGHVAERSKDGASRYRITTFGLFHPSEALANEEQGVTDPQKLYYERSPTRSPAG
jgi:glycosyltransferase involved in cell wall biosynthesis